MRGGASKTGIGKNHIREIANQFKVGQKRTFRRIKGKQKKEITHFRAEIIGKYRNHILIQTDLKKESLTYVDFAIGDLEVVA